MSWFRHIPHRREETRRHPHHTSAMADELQREIEQNREQLRQHRDTQHKEKEHADGKLHRR